MTQLRTGDFGKRRQSKLLSSTELTEDMKESVFYCFFNNTFLYFCFQSRLLMRLVNYYTSIFWMLIINLDWKLRLTYQLKFVDIQCEKYSPSSFAILSLSQVFRTSAVCVHVRQSTKHKYSNLPLSSVSCDLCVLTCAT